jgi:hypothetical protein
MCVFFQKKHWNEKHTNVMVHKNNKEMSLPNKQSYTVYASEIAALVGFDKFNTCEATVNSIKCRNVPVKTSMTDSFGAPFGDLLNNSIASEIAHQKKTFQKSIGDGVLISGRVKEFILSVGEKVPRIIKHRKDRLPMQLYKNDHVQCLAYAFLTDSKTVVFCNIVETTGEQQSVIVRFCPKRWGEVVRSIKLALNIDTSPDTDEFTMNDTEKTK